jgi:histidine ammonia-lyase
MRTTLDGQSLTPEEVLRVARGGENVALANVAIERMREARLIVEEAVALGGDVYGLTTGVGARKRVRVSAADADDFNRLLVLNSRVGQGAPAAEDVVRATMLILVNGFARAAAGVRPELAELVVEKLNGRARPTVRTLGSVGQADLASMADLANDLLRDTDFRLAAGEGLALLSSNAFSTGSAVLAVADCARLLNALDVAGALDLEAFACNLNIIHPLVGESRPYPGIQASVERMRELLDGSYLWDEGAARNLQDPLTFRCIPQVHGAARDALAFVQHQFEIELNAIQGSPVISWDERRVVSVANFESLPIAASTDFLRIALAPALTSATERIVKLLQEPLSGLPAGLAARFGVAEDALSELGVAGQALAAEARLLAQPVSFELVSSSHAEGIEDRTAMASLSARRLAEMVALGERIVAIELVVGAQAVDVRAPARLGVGTARARSLVRDLVPFTDEGEPVPQDLEPVRDLVASGALSSVDPSRRAGGWAW